MKANKKGISLIVLVITIIVIIILAAAVILTINNNNPMDNANKAKYSSDRATMQQAFTTTIGSIMGDAMTNPKFAASLADATAKTQLSAAYTIPDSGANKNTVFYFTDGGGKGTIVFNSGTNVKQEGTTVDGQYFVGYELPRYGTGAGSGIWTLNAAGNLILTVNGTAYDGTK